MSDLPIYILGRTALVFSPFLVAIFAGALLKPLLGSSVFVLLGAVSMIASISIIGILQDREIRRR